MTKPIPPNKAGAKRTRTGVKPSVESALARATIHLNLGEEDAAGREVDAALDADRKFKVFLPYAGFGKTRITGHAFMPHGLAYWSPRHGITVVTRRVWNQQVMGPAPHRFAKELSHRAAPTWMAYDEHDFDMLNALSPSLRDLFGDRDQG